MEFFLVSWKLKKERIYREDDVGDFYGLGLGAVNIILIYIFLFEFDRKVLFIWKGVWEMWVSCGFGEKEIVFGEYCYRELEGNVYCSFVYENRRLEII